MPKLKEKPQQAIELTLDLKGRSINDIDSFVRLLEVIETFLFKNFKWEFVGNREVVIEEYEQRQKYKQGIEIKYKIFDVRSNDNLLQVLKASVLREAEIRLFDCKGVISAIE